MLRGGILHRRNSGKHMFCSAPINNMLIDQSGKVRICCHNSNDFRIGKYPEQSLKEIWFGPIRESMVAEMQKGTIPIPCTDCVKGGLDAASPDSKIATSHTRFLRTPADYPLQIEFLLDNTCNLSCIMCASNHSSSLRNDGFAEDPVHFDQDFIEQLKPFLDHLEFAVFSGGEPFMIPMYEQIWSYLKNNNPQSGIYVQTNGTILNEKVRQTLEEYDLQLGISIDSLDPITYASIRKNADLKSTLDNLTFFRSNSQHKGRRLTFMVTPMTLNADEIPNLVDYCETNDLMLSLSILNWPYHLALWSMRADELAALIDSYQAYLARKDQGPRNLEVFRHFVNLCRKYRDQKLVYETDRETYQNALQGSVSRFKAEFNLALSALPSNHQETNIRITNLINALTAAHLPDFPFENFIYLIFQNKPIHFFEHLLDRATDRQVYLMAETRLKEVITLYRHDAFGHLGISLH